MFVSVNSIFAQRKSVSAAEATGTFLTKKEDGNEMKILALGGGKLKVEFALTYVYKLPSGELTANTGEPNGIAKIAGDLAVLDLSEENRICKINIKFIKVGTVKVTQAGECDGIVGGVNVTADGIYKRKSPQKPKFSF